MQLQDLIFIDIFRKIPQNLPQKIYIMWKFCIQKLYKMYTTDVHKMYTRHIQNVSHILTNFCINFVYKIKRTMAAKIFIKNLYKSLSKCEIRFVHILYTFCIH